METIFAKLEDYKPYVYLKRTPKGNEGTPSTVETFEIHVMVYIPAGKFTSYKVVETPPTHYEHISLTIPLKRASASKRMIHIALTEENDSAPEQLIVEKFVIPISNISHPFLETGVQVIVAPDQAPDTDGSTTVNYGDADDDD